jgi:hypothetical protein
VPVYPPDAPPHLRGIAYSWASARLHQATGGATTVRHVAATWRRAAVCPSARPLWRPSPCASARLEVRHPPCPALRVSLQLTPVVLSLPTSAVHKAVVARHTATQRAASSPAAPLAAKRSVAGQALRTAPVRVGGRRRGVVWGHADRSGNRARRGGAATTPSTHTTALSPLVALLAQWPVGGEQPRKDDTCPLPPQRPDNPSPLSPLPQRGVASASRTVAPAVVAVAAVRAALCANPAATPF